MKICIITSNFYPKISKMLLDGAINEIKKSRISSYKIFKVNGTYEIPVVLSSLVNKYDVFIVLGCVIKGETSHFKFLCSSVFNALMDLSIKYKIPIGNGILTCNTKKQAYKRADLNKKNKGADAVKAAVSVYKTIKK